MTNLRKKGVKPTIYELNKDETCLFPRKRYSTIRTTLSTLKIENPERKWIIEIVDDGIKITCIS